MNASAHAATPLAAYRTRRRLHACGFRTELLGAGLLGARRGDEAVLLQCSAADARFGRLVACFALDRDLPDGIVCGLADETNAGTGAYAACFDPVRRTLAIRTRSEVEAAAPRPDFSHARSDLERYADAFFRVAYDRARVTGSVPC